MNGFLDHTSNENGVWMPVADLAKERGVTRQSMSERVNKLETEGKLTTRKQGRSRLVNVPEFDLAVEQVGDAHAENRASVRSQNEETGSIELRQSQAKKAEYDAEMARLKLEREQGKVRSVDEIQDAGTQAAVVIIQTLDKLPGKAQEIHEQAKSGDLQATRTLLKNLTHEIRQNLCEVLGALEQNKGIDYG